MDLAIWDYPPAEFLVSGFTSGAVSNPFRIKRHRPEKCAALLVEDEVDVALMPTTLALQAANAIDVIPSVGLVSWRYPYARLVWGGGLHDFPETIAYDRRVAQERIVTRIVLQEHYQVSPTFVPYDPRPPKDLIDMDEDAALLVGPNVPALQPEPFTMDVGREWYELANYPMVWGLYVTKRDRATDEMIEALIASGEAADENRDVWVQAQETTASLNEFYREDLRTGIDKLAVASLTELRKYLFYYDVTEDVPDLPFVYLEEDEEEEQEE
ncbi:MAG: MqnA/MqnD/SBP family protein [Salinibacter sp.]